MCVCLLSFQLQVNTVENDKSNISQILKDKEPHIWVFTGNSITQGAKHTHGMRAYPEIFSERVRFEMGRSRDYVINTAVSGHTTRDLLDDFERRIGRFEPSVVILMVGTNDAAISNHISIEEFAKNLSQLIKKIRDIGAIPVIMSPNIIIETEAPERDRLSQYVVKIKETAQTNEIIFVDNWMLWNTDMQKKYEGRVFEQLLNDPLHPNGLGHKEIAFALFKSLAIFDPNQPSCGSPYYEGEH